MESRSLFEQDAPVYRPRRPTHFNPKRIVLARGSEKPEYANFVKSICTLYPAAEVTHCWEVPHNRIDLGTNDLREAHFRGKQTLVLAEHRSAVRFSAEEGNACPNYWHISPYGFCPFDCSYCYLAGTPGVRFSPTVKIFLNLHDILDTVDNAATRTGRPTAFYLGKLQDALALDPLTGYSRQLVPFFAKHPYARMTLLTKSTHVENLLPLVHGNNTILSWSLNPQEVVARFEHRTPSVDARIQAMKLCANAGYPIRAVVMPVIPIDNWQRYYQRFLAQLLQAVPLQRITFGGICSYTSAKTPMEDKVGKFNAISLALAMGESKSPDGRARYPISVRVEMYRFLIDSVREYARNLEVALCLEEPDIFHALNLTSIMGRCNCIL